MNVLIAIRPIPVLIVFNCLLLLGCSQPAPESNLLVSEILGSSDAGEFKTVLQPRPFYFPQDHRAHPEYKNEWWYLTGNVQDENGRHFGYQVTFFRLAQAPEKISSGESAWRSDQIWMSHIAITDVQNRQHHSYEKFSRQALGLAGTQAPFKVWLENWKLFSLGKGGHGFPWQLNIKHTKMDLDLTLTSEKKPVLQGRQGFSEKSSTPGNASYYYSFSRLHTQGSLRLNDKTFTVSGGSWLDREWGSSQLDENQLGWDWFSIQLNDNQEMMYYQLRDKDGKPHPASEGKWTNQNGESQTINTHDIELTPIKWWQSEDGKRFPIRWRLDYPNKNSHWIVEAMVDDQYMTTLVRYWEGAVRVLDVKSQKVLGVGYLEMTGY